MAGGKRRHRRAGDRPKPNTSRTSRKEAPAGAPTTSVHEVPEDLLEQILLRVDSAATLVRAASACKRWCRVAADARFLRRFGSLRAPRVAGHYHTVNPFFDDSAAASGGRPVFVPSPAATAAAVDARRFSLDFLPDGGAAWQLADSRGSLLLFKKEPDSTWWRGRDHYLAEELLVCEPLTRRCQGILRPDAMFGWCLGLFLLDGEGYGDGEAHTSGGRRIGMDNFRIVAVLSEFHKWGHGCVPRACVFSSGSDGGWRVLHTAPDESDSGIITIPDEYDAQPGEDAVIFAGRANGSFYWAIGEDDALLALGEATVGFSLVDVPESVLRSHDRYNLRVIGGEDGALRVVRLVDNELKVFARRHGSEEWELESLVHLPEATRALPGRESRYFGREAMIVAADAAHVLVTPQEKTWLFSVDVETAEVERARERNRYAGLAYGYELPWPPNLMACAQRGRQRRSRR